MGDPEEAAAVTQVFTWRRMEWGRMHGERANDAHFTFPQLFDLKVIQKAPDGGGVGSFPEVHPEDANAQCMARYEGPAFELVLGSAALCC